MERLINLAKERFFPPGFDCAGIPGHEGGRNRMYVCGRGGEPSYVLRVSGLADRTEEDFLAETEFVHFLAAGGAPVADVIPSVNGRLVECIDLDGQRFFVSLFAYAKGILLADNGYRYRAGAPLEEYFYNTGKALGAIHRLSRQFQPEHRRRSYFEKYNRLYIDRLIPDSYAGLKRAMAERLDAFRELPADEGSFGLVHFDFSDGNYHIDMDTGAITVFDFENCMYCWYMFDLANLWIHGTGWCRHEKDASSRRKYMEHYFAAILEGYRSETQISQDMLHRLPLFIDMVLIENVVDAFECCAREGEEMDGEDIAAAAEALIGKIPYAGFC